VRQGIHGGFAAERGGEMDNGSHDPDRALRHQRPLPEFSIRAAHIRQVSALVREERLRLHQEVRMLLENMQPLDNERR
jgi:hypothetical protein